MEQEISNMEIDQKTGLLNDNSFVQDFHKMIATAIKDCTDLSLAMLDIDNLEQINNDYGESFGDTVLIAIANYLKRSVQQKVQLYRYNGDQFAMLLPETEKEAAYTMIHNLIVAFSASAERKALQSPDEMTIGFSAGIACCPEDGMKESHLIRRANAALLVSKTTGKNKVSRSKIEKFVSQKSLYTSEQLHKLSILSKKTNISEGILLREALDDLLKKYDR